MVEQGPSECGLIASEEDLQMQFDIRLDRVLITCEALGLRSVQATNASSSHIVMCLAALHRVPPRRLSSRECDCHCFCVGDGEMALRTGRHRPHTYVERF